MVDKHCDPEVRSKCVGLLSGAFIANADSPGPERAAALARKIEEEIFRAAGNRSGYSKLFRTKYLNLKEKSNRWLCNSVYNETIGVGEFVAMTGEQMKSDELRATEAKMKKLSLLDSQIAKKEAETDLFFCTKCKQRKCSYRQLQTRSADEPMTTYVYCVCGNTWKFS